MYGMVSSDHGPSKSKSKSKSAAAQAQLHRQQQQQAQLQQQHDQEQMDKTGTARHNKSIYIRLLDFFRHAWTGVKFALDSEFSLDDVERAPRFRPESLQSLSRLTHFTETEIKRIYRGFKAECPNGIVEQDTFCDIYAQFFGIANSGQYARYFFNTFDQGRTGLVSFDTFVVGLSVLSHGTLEEKLSWVFRLYDINGDGFISRDEMTDAVTSIFQLMGNSVEPPVDMTAIEERVDLIFQKMDGNLDGIISLDEFLECCLNDKDVRQSMQLFPSLV